LLDAQSSAIPVRVLPPSARRTFELGRHLKLLVAVDGPGAVVHAARWTRRIAPRFTDCSIDLMSVRLALAPVGAAQGMPSEGTRNRNEQLGSAAIYTARVATDDPCPGATARTSEGHVNHELCRYAAQMGADAIVVGPRDLGTLGKATLASVSSALLQTSNWRMIFVREAVA